MKFIFFFSIFLSWLTGQAQTSSKQAFPDTALSKKITIAGFCLCQTTLADLKNLDPGLQEVAVEEMEMCKDGFIQDSRFENRKGYSSKKYPGIIFQKDDKDLISKIRLTKDFVGHLPDGTPVDMKTLLARDVIHLYPSYAETWKSRGCSDYWNLTDDTLSFFVKIDKDKKPQYPVDEAYYGEKPVEGIDLVVSCYRIFEPSDLYKKRPNQPIFFVDSVNVASTELKKYQPTDVASVTVYKGANAVKLLGLQGVDGAIYMETKTFARNRYWNFFKSKSAYYLKRVPTPASDSSVVYILNGKVLTTNFEGDLALIDETTFVELSVIDKERLKKDFGITDKKYGILLKTKAKKKPDTSAM